MSKPKATAQDWIDLTEYIEAGSRNRVTSLLRSVDFLSEPIRPSSVSPPLLYAVEGSFQDILIDLINYGFSTSETDVQGQAFSHWVAKYGQTNILRCMSDNGINIEKTDNNGATPLMIACAHGHSNTVKLLLDLGACFDRTYPPEFSSALHHAAYGGSFEICQLLLDHGANPNQVDRHNETALHTAVENDHRCLITLLVNVGCEVNGNSLRRIVSPLFNALDNGNTQTIRLLQRLGAEFNVLSGSGQSPLQVALLRKDLEMLRVLLQLNAVYVPRGIFPFQIACRFDESDFSKLLFDSGVYTNHCLFSSLSSENENRGIMFTSPRPLFLLSVFKIRSILGTQVLTLSEDLPIPNHLKPLIRLEYLF